MRLRRATRPSIGLSRPAARRRNQMDEYLAQQSFDDLVGVTVTPRFDPSYRASPSLVPPLVTIAPLCGRFASVPLAGVSSGEGSFG